MRVAVLHGRVADDAPPDEKDVLVEVGAVVGALRELGHEAEPVPLSLDLALATEALRHGRFELVFNLVETIDGHGRLIHVGPALLDVLGLPYTGAPTDAMFLTSNKVLAKKALAAAGIPTAPWASEEEALDDAVPFEGPYIVKSIWEHASIGLDEKAIVTTRGALRDLVATRRGQKGGLFVEAFVDGREFNLSILAQEREPEVLPIAEMTFVGFGPGMPRIVSYRAKWDDDSFESRNTVRSYRLSEKDEPLATRLREVARSCWWAFGLRGYARVDFRVDAAGRPYVLEVNANPCISPDGGFVAAARQAGIELPGVVERILASAMPRGNG